MESQIKIFESGIEEGIMSRNKKFYDDNLSQKEIDDIFLKTRLSLGEKYSFDGKKIFQPYQKTDSNGLEYADGKYVVIGDKHMKSDDFWYENIPCDILIISNKYSKVVLGNQMADCPILIIEDRKLGVTALAHCGVSYIDRLLPVDTVRALQKEYNSSLDDLFVYIGSCAKKDSYVYETYPKWAHNNEVWEHNIELKSDGYHLDITNAIISQLKRIGIKNIEVSEVDTITDPRYYSHYASNKGKKEKLGQNFVGFYYLEK